MFTKHVTQVVVYSTKPEGMIVGEFSVKKILSDTPEKLWEKTSFVSGISKEFFDQYFKGRDKGYALQIENPVLYKKPINPFDVFTSFVAPQSFKYLEEDDIEESVSGQPHQIFFQGNRTKFSIKNMFCSTKH